MRGDKEQMAQGMAESKAALKERSIWGPNSSWYLATNGVGILRLIGGFQIFPVGHHCANAIELTRLSAIERGETEP